MEGSLEQSKFEDDCRDMFGISSYILFTIDKLIVQLAKQLQILITDDSCAKLLALYAYEGSRPRGSLEVIYHSNVLELLPEDDRCFRFEFSQVLSSNLDPSPASYSGTGGWLINLDCRRRVTLPFSC